MGCIPFSCRVQRQARHVFTDPNNARSAPFNEPRYLCLPGWEYFPPFNRELAHVLTQRCFGNFSLQESHGQVS